MHDKNLKVTERIEKKVRFLPHCPQAPVHPVDLPWQCPLPPLPFREHPGAGGPRSTPVTGGPRSTNCILKFCVFFCSRFYKWTIGILAPKPATQNLVQKAGIHHSLSALGPSFNVSLRKLDLLRHLFGVLSRDGYYKITSKCLVWD